MKNQLLLHLIMGLQIPFNYIRSSKPFTRFSWHSSNIKIIRSKYWFWGNKWKQRRWDEMALEQPRQTPALREPHCCSCRRQTLSVWGPQGAAFTLIKAEECPHIRATKHGVKFSLEGKPEPGVMRHDRHEPGVFTSSIDPYSEVGILSQNSIAK